MSTEKDQPRFDWNEIERKSIYDAEIFQLSLRTMKNSRTNYQSDFHVLESVDWVNVIPVTDKGEVVMIRQYRHGVNKVCLEIPGGMLDSAEEDPAQAALREMEEETGYSSSNIKSLGWVYPNPAIINNRCHLFVANQAYFTSSQALEPAEDIDVELVSVDRIPKLMAGNEIAHAVIYCCLARFLLWNQQNS